MNLLKKNIHMYRSRCEAMNQVTLEDDRNLPENKPDVASINLEKANVCIEEVRPGTDSVLLRGKLQFALLYHTLEPGSSLIPFTGELPFEERIMVKDMVSTDSVNAQGEVEDFSVSCINSRKLSIRCLLTLSVCAEELYDEEVPTAMHSDDGEKLEYRRTPVRLSQIAVCRSDLYRIRDEVSIPSNYPNIREILWDMVHLMDVEFKILDGKIAIQGDAHVFLLYEGEGENHPVVNFESVLPFSGILECSGCREGMISDIQYTVDKADIVVRPDLDGEERCIGLELALDIRIRAYEEETVEMVSDLYGVTKEVRASTRNSMLKRVRNALAGKMKVTEHIRIPAGSAPVFQILHSEGSICQLQHSVEEDGIHIKGGITAKIMYIVSDDDSPYACTEVQIPYQYTLEIPGGAAGTPDGMLEIGRMRGEVEQLQVTMLDTEEMDVKAILCFSTMVIETIPVEIIDEVTVGELSADIRKNLPGMAIYVAKEGDNLWNIGRKYYVSVDSLREWNQLEKDDLQKGQKLLVVKGM